MGFTLLELIVATGIISVIWMISTSTYKGIESKEQLTILYENNYDYAQGFYFSKPLSADAFEDFYRKQNNIVKFKA